MAVPLHLLQFFFFFFLIMELILIVSCCTLLFNVIYSKNNIHPSAQLSKAICVCVFPQAVLYTYIYILVSFILICFSGIHKSLILFHKNHIMNVINTLKKRSSNGLVMVDFYIISSWPETLVWFPVSCRFSLNDCWYMMYLRQIQRNLFP